MKVAFYKGKGNIYNKLIRFWDGGIYSHCELVFSDGMSVSASYTDGKQVRMKAITYDPAKWDFVELSDRLEDNVRHFFEQTKGKDYDLIGQIRFLISPLKGSKSGYWCSEWIAHALGMRDSWRHSPNSLYAVLASYSL